MMPHQSAAMVKVCLAPAQIFDLAAQTLSASCVCTCFEQQGLRVPMATRDWNVVKVARLLMSAVLLRAVTLTVGKQNYARWGA